jgi:hypothetical protein
MNLGFRSGPKFSVQGSILPVAPLNALTASVTT